MNRVTTSKTYIAIAVAAATLMLTGCQADSGTSGGSGGLETPDNMCNDFTSQSYMQCGNYEPPPNMNDNNWGTAG
jgi:hypothetical protein